MRKSQGTLIGGCCGSWLWKAAGEGGIGRSGIQGLKIAAVLKISAGVKNGQRRDVLLLG